MGEGSRAQLTRPKLTLVTRQDTADRSTKQSRFARYAWIVLAVNVLVILWGAMVRALGAGAGCGNHWPLCNGLVTPQPQLKTVIEFGHRLTSGIALLLVVALVLYAWRVFPKGHWARRSAVWAGGFELSEGLIGAGLVLLGHVAENKSTARGYSLSLHQTNTLLLLAALALTAWFATRAQLQWTISVKPLRIILTVAALGTFLSGISGAIAALGDTLFRSASFAEGMRQDFDPLAHPFVRLRILHPMIAIALGLYVIALASYLLYSRTASITVRRLCVSLVTITVLQLGLGGLNLILRAPVPLQLAHLLLADLLWITFVLLSAELLVSSFARVENRDSILALQANESRNVASILTSARVEQKHTNRGYQGTTGVN